jgi:hypothetical protein
MNPISALLALLIAANPQAKDQIYTVDDVQAGSELRSNVYIVVSTLYHYCSKSDVLEPAIKRYAAMRDGQKSHARKIDFALPHADYDYQMSLVDLACPDLTEDEQQRMDEINARVANTTMDRMEENLRELAERGE